VAFIADINARSMGMNYFQAEVLALNLPHHFPPLLAVHLVPVVWPCTSGCFFSLLLWLGFHANLSLMDSTWPGPGGETRTISPSGSGRSPWQDNTRHHPHNRQLPEPCS